MTGRTVVAFEPLGPDVVVKLVDAPADVTGIGVNAVVDVSALPGGGARGRGEALLARLTHPPVAAGLAHALAAPPGSGAAPLYFHTLAAAADALPWEELYAAPHGFCALDARWPVARIAARRRPVPDRAYAGEFNVVAVLSAAGRSGAAQLAALLAATGSPDGAAVGARLRVVTGDETVLRALREAGRPDVTAAELAPTADGLIRQIRDGNPDVLHVLGHGGESSGVRVVSFATVADFDAGEPVGTVRLKLADVVQAVLDADPWLVVLAACETADAVEGAALAHEIANAGVPAVVGMRRLVDLADADRFCAAFYPELMAVVRAAVGDAGPPGVRHVDWAGALTAPRIALGGADPSTADTWSDPVLYVQHDPFRVFVGGASMGPGEYSARRGELDTLEGYLRSVPGADPRVRAAVQERIAALRTELDSGVAPVDVERRRSRTVAPATP